MTTYGLKNQTMKTSDLEEILYMAKIDDVEIYPGESKIKTSKGICNIDDGSQGGTDRVAFYVSTIHESEYFNSFGGPPDTWLIEQLPKAIKYYNYIIQGIDSESDDSMMCGTYCLYFLYLLANKVN